MFGVLTGTRGDAAQTGKPGVSPPEFCRQPSTGQCESRKPSVLEPVATPSLDTRSSDLYGFGPAVVHMSTLVAHVLRRGIPGLASPGTSRWFREDELGKMQDSPRPHHCVVEEAPSRRLLGLSRSDSPSQR